MAGATSFGPLLDAVRGLAWPALRTARGAAVGTHPSRLRGSSPEFTEYRPYRPGEDPRRLDWKLLARTDRAFLRVTTDRTLLGTLVLLDASASMAFPEGPGSKWEHACRLAVGLLAVAHAAGDPVGLRVAAAGGTASLPPRTRRGVVAEAARLLESVRPGGDAPLAPLLDAPPRGVGRIVVVSDFLGDADALLRAARPWALAGGEIHAVHVLAPEELEPGAGPGMAFDPERPELRRPLGPEALAGYAAAFGAWRAELARAWRAAGASFTAVRTDEPAEHAVRRVVHPGSVAAP